MVWEPDSSAFWLFGGDMPFRVSGTAACAVAALLDGSRTEAEIQAQAIANGVSPMAAHALLQSWQTRGLIDVVGDEGTDPGAAALTPQNAAALGASLRLHLPELRQILPVVVVDDLFADEIVRVPGPAVIVALESKGPVVGVVECTRCLTERSRLGRSFHMAAAARCGLDRPPLLPGDRDAAVARVGELLERLADDDVNVLLSWSDAGKPHRHVVVQVPGCDACDPGSSSLLPKLSQPRVATDTDVVLDDGGYRVVSPESTWANYQHLVSDLVGMVPWVKPRGEERLHVHVAGPNPAVVNRGDPGALIAGARMLSAGKGLNFEASRTGALCESLERYSFVHRGDEPNITASFENLGEQAIHPNRISLFSHKQLAEADASWDAGGHFGHGFFRVPRQFDPTKVVEWTEAESLTGGGPRQLPSSLVWFSHPEALDGGYAACSNGAAAGNTVDEATLQGLFELIERDSVALWWYSRARRPGVDLDSCDDPRIRQALAQLDVPGRHSWLLDLTSDLGVPAYVAVNADMDGAHVLFGFGAHVDPVIACVRALTEAAQFASSLPETGDFRSGNPVEDAWMAEVTTASEPWLAPTHLVRLPATPGTTSVSKTLTATIDQMSRRGLEVLRVQATRRDIGLPVVRVVVPGLRHFWNRFAPGRLYDVPVQLGWVPAEISEADLNPRWMFL